MARKKESETQNPKEDVQFSNQESLQNDANLLSEAINQDTEALMNVAQRLETASTNFSHQQKGLRQMIQLQSDLKNVLAQVMGSIGELNTPQSMMIQKESTIVPVNQGKPVDMPKHQSNKGDCGCECVSADCCCFEIKILKIRAIQAQLEPADLGGVPGLHNNLEVRLAGLIDNTGVIYPGLNTTVELPVGSVNPGPWIKIDCPIKRICLKKGTTKTIEIDFEATEVDKGAERPTGFKDEYGQASGSITLDCCMPTIYPPTPVELSFQHGGTGGPGGTKRGKIEIAYYAKRVCC